ncbi:MAG: hypothetical protein ACOYL3_23285 [Desulfuromonadaceae bacterium]
MKKDICSVVAIIFSSVSFVWADIDSKKLLQSIFPITNSRKTITRELSRPIDFERPIIAIKQSAIKQDILLAQTSFAQTQSDAAPSTVAAKVELPVQQSVQQTAVAVEPTVSRKGMVVANGWIEGHHMYGGLIIPGCDDAIAEEYGSDLPERIYCKSKDEGTVYKARSSESDPHSKGYLWNYR